MKILVVDDEPDVVEVVNLCFSLRWPEADVTERLLTIDPFWQWEPFALDEQGLPALDTDDLGHPIGMWIRLTILGVTRPGYGSCPSRQSDAVKVLIGDAIRNAAMRFGVALDLWRWTCGRRRNGPTLRWTTRWPTRGSGRCPRTSGPLTPRSG